MEEIRIYHSIRKSIAIMAVSFAFVAMGVFQFVNGDSAFIIWASILFFGICGLFFVFLMLRERISHKPYYVITDKCVIMDSGIKKWEVRFADVEEFYLVNVMSNKQIGIRYKKDIEFQKINNASNVGRRIRKMNERIAGVQESLPADDLTIKPQQLCDLLNMKLTK